MWGCILIAISEYFTPNQNSETNTSQGKANFTIISTIFQYVQIFLNTNILFHITRVRGCGFYQWGER